MVVFTKEQAVLDLVHHSNSLQVGAELDVAVGPMGRGANSQLHTGDWALHEAYSYAHSHGFFVGMSLEGSVLSIRKEVNAKFYGLSAATAAMTSTNLNLLSQPGPKAVQPLYQVLERAMQRELHRYTFRPSKVLFPSSHPTTGSTIYNNDNSALQDESYVILSSASSAVDDPYSREGGGCGTPPDGNNEDETFVIYNS